VTWRLIFAARAAIFDEEYSLNISMDVKAGAAASEDGDLATPFPSPNPELVPKLILTTYRI
jgi:hypothetical protein